MQLPKVVHDLWYCSLFVDEKNGLVLIHISYCEQIAILKLFKINVFLYVILPVFILRAPAAHSVMEYGGILIWFIPLFPSRAEGYDKAAFLAVKWMRNDRVVMTINPKTNGLMKLWFYNIAIVLSETQVPCSRQCIISAHLS